MKAFLGKVRRIPWWGWAAGIGFFALQLGLYTAGVRLSRALGTVNYAFEWKIPAIDDRIGLVPVFVLPYIYSYIFWLCAPAAVSLTKRRHFINYAVGQLAAYLIGFLFFIFV